MVCAHAPPPIISNSVLFSLCSSHTGVSVPRPCAHPPAPGSLHSLFSWPSTTLCPSSPTQFLALILSVHHVLRDSFPVPSHNPTSNSVHFFLGRSKHLKKLRESKIIKPVYSAPLPGPSNLCQNSTFALISSNLFFENIKHL